MKKLFLILITTLLLISTPVFAAEMGLGSPILPHRIYDMSTGEIIDFEKLLEVCSISDVVTLGEHHGDPATHRIELAILRGLNRHKDGEVILSMEMFERDVQDVVDKYIADEIDDDEFLDNARPPSSYKRDYRRLIKYCRRFDIPVVAANLPRPMASKIAGNGYDGAFALFSDDEKQYLPGSYTFSDGPYREKLEATFRMMGGHGMAMEMTDEILYKYYQAQALKDDAMAESVATASSENPGGTVYQIVGSFHVEDYLGLYEKIVNRMPSAEVISILVFQVDDLSIDLSEIPHALGDNIPGCDYAILVLEYSHKYLR